MKEQPKPEAKVDERHQQHGYQPEPKADEELLVEQVDGQSALHAVLVNVVAQVADLEVAEGVARKGSVDADRVRAVQQIADEVEAVSVVGEAEK